MGAAMSISHFSPDAWRFIFNTPLECGLRCAALLLATYPSTCDLQRLVQYEYLLVHSGDVRQGPPSLHPAAPHRSGELLVRRALIERGILFMMSRQVVWPRRQAKPVAPDSAAAKRTGARPDGNRVRLFVRS